MAAFLSLWLLVLAVVCSPVLIERAVSLEWYVGDLRPIAFALQAAFGTLSLTCYLARRRIDAVFARAFPTRREVAYAAITTSSAMLLALGTAEMVLRSLGLPYEKEPAPVEKALTQFDPELGWSNVRERSIVRAFGSDRREVVLHFDDIGSRVPSASHRHDRLAPTLMLVGCSFTMGFGVTYEESFAGQLESAPAFPLQVVDLGVLAFGTDQSLLALKRHLPEFDVKVVIYTFICDHVRRNAKEGRRWRGTKPRFVLRPDGSLSLHQKPLRREDPGFSHLLAYFSLAMDEYGPIPELDLTKALVAEMRHYVESKGALFIVLNWQRCGTHWGAAPFEGMDLDVVNAADRAPPQWTEWNIPGDGHPDARAHQYIGALLLRELRLRGAIE